jgi:hypothetical protein
MIEIRINVTAPNLANYYCTAMCINTNSADVYVICIRFTYISIFILEKKEKMKNHITNTFLKDTKHSSSFWILIVVVFNCVRLYKNVKNVTASVQNQCG